MPPSKLAQLGFYTASFLNAVSVAGHTQVGFDVVFPSLRDKLILNEDGAIFAKIGWLEGNIVFGILGELSYGFLNRPHPSIPASEKHAEYL